MHGRDEILEIVVADDQPLEAERVVFRSIFESGSAATASSSCSTSLAARDELSRRHGLEDDGGDAGSAQPELDLERDARGRQREERSRAPEAARFRRPKRTSFNATRYATGRPISRAISARAASRFSSGGWSMKSSAVAASRSSG